MISSSEFTGSRPLHFLEIHVSFSLLELPAFFPLHLGEFHAAPYWESVPASLKWRSFTMMWLLFSLPFDGLSVNYCSVANSSLLEQSPLTAISYRPVSIVLKILLKTHLEFSLIISDKWIRIPVFHNLKF